MILGTDVNLDTCKEEGYLMVEFDENIEFNKDKKYRLFGYYDSVRFPERLNVLRVDVHYSFNQLAEIYHKNINGYYGNDNEINVNFIDPILYDLLTLASEINYYEEL